MNLEQLGAKAVQANERGLVLFVRQDGQTFTRRMVYPETFIRVTLKPTMTDLKQRTYELRSVILTLVSGYYFMEISN